MIKTETMTINMGPQHPSTHGVLRLVLELDGERIVRTVPHIGYLHTGVEKTCEYKTYIQAMTMTDRLDYLSPMMNNLAFMLSTEKLVGVEVPPRAQAIRVLMNELQRIASHLVWLGTHALDIGAMSVMLYCFREREMILDLFEEVCGARLTVSYFRIGGLSADLPEGYLGRVKDFITYFKQRVDEYEGLLTRNKLWLRRTVGIGKINAEEAKNWGFSGPCLRASGVAWDIRKTNPYSGYEKYDFEVPVGVNGDVYDRYLVRIAEMRQSARIVEQALASMPSGAHIADAPKVTLPPRNTLHTSMEALIHHFLIICNGVQPPPGEAYVPIESSKGELGFYMVSDGSARPYRVRMRPPSFKNLQVLPKLAEGLMVADLIAVIGSIDIVLGEIDR
ncbi:MAG: NADH dehydrogenase (quinone) subunit D [Acidobacteria bacterium]|nr:NADH dehydrogenase (quinone) subunit D [Acidobacteriota bacterium]